MGVPGGCITDKWLVSPTLCSNSSNHWHCCVSLRSQLSACTLLELGGTGLLQSIAYGSVHAKTCIKKAAKERYVPSHDHATIMGNTLSRLDAALTSCHHISSYHNTDRYRKSSHRNVMQVATIPPHLELQQPLCIKKKAAKDKRQPTTAATACMAPNKSQPRCLLFLLCCVSLQHKQPTLPKGWKRNAIK